MSYLRNLCFPRTVVSNTYCVVFLFSPYENDGLFFFTSIVFRSAHVLFTLFVFTWVQWYPTHIVLCFCFLFIRFVDPMLPVSLI